MASVSLDYELQDERVRAAFGAFLRLSEDASPIMADIATIGESSTRERFDTEEAPSGSKWEKSLRARISGGKTLTAAGHLGDSVASRSERTSAEWGVNRIYAAIHQFGGVIKARAAKALRFRLASGEFVTTRQVRMPARPYLGISAGDEADILAAIERRIEGTLRAD